jgi:bla regulator protein blaR1
MVIELLRYLVALTVISSAAIGITLLIRRPVRLAFGAEASYSTWLLVPVAMGAMLLPNATGADSAMVSYLQINAVSALSEAVARSLNPSLDSMYSFDRPTWLFGTWFAGAALLSVYLVGLQRAYLKSLGTLAESRGVLRAEISSGCPALVGVFRPKVILPVDFEMRYTSQEQLLILAHEQVHVRRRDTLWNALVALLRCLFWFNPLVHLAASLVRVDQELACDAAVVERHPAARRTYAGAMLKTQLADAALPAGCHWRSTHPLRERLEMLKRNVPGRTRRALGGALVVVASLAVGYTAWAAEPVAPVESKPEARTADLKRFVKAVFTFAPELRVETSADSMTSGPNGTTILEGNVRIVASRLAGSRQTTTVRTERAVISSLGNGSIKVDFENGTVANQ